MSDLLPCPFCGRLPEDIVDATRVLGTWRIVHRCKIIPYFSIDRTSKEAAIAAWNTRAPADGRQRIETSQFLLDEPKGKGK